MNPLARRIARMIEMDGPIGIGTFMMLALHDREMGFYATRESIGAKGAFITAPEMTQIFGELIALWCATCWREQGRPAAPLLVDLGPGRGMLVSDMLRALRAAPDFLESLEVVLVEASAKLESVQRGRLTDAAPPVRWVRRWNELGRDRPVFVVANEFFDALPIRQFVMTERGWCERMVVSKADALAFGLSPQPVQLPIREDRIVGEGAVYEICPAAPSLAQEIGEAIATNGGAALVIDYGHAEQAYGDTLQALRSHAQADVLAAPGEADISAHVDFAALAEGARRGGARAHGPVDQRDFLQTLGIGPRGEQLARANPERAEEIRGALARLTQTEAMGTLFKALALTPAGASVPLGFA
ncbi:MAG TPA: SAM-dependent methyltransferase [Rhizomicrobium sp.]|jgi:SAM-dependent MidA family methyltransferase|nr:SAM-dependent methyltransferase [Rhizomicrobium sp.]